MYCTREGGWKINEGKRRETKGNGLLSLKTDLRVVFTRRLVVIFPVERTKSPRWLFNVEECHACVASGFVSLICIQRSGYQSRTLSKQERKFIRHRYSSIGELSNESIMRALSLPIALVLFRTAYLRTPGTDIFFFFYFSPTSSIEDCDSKFCKIPFVASSC